ncbi:MAG: DNA polymerase III subunit gamma/tau [Rickettsiales bacterium]|nr:DNA polymerase III subunit gamma/tau [Rickettsiales bacterium]
MNHVSLANKYRPKNFSELKGQKVLVQTVTNAIKNHNPHHAYLLTGIRGIGKTTSARIIAKTLNCSELQTDEQNAIPCEKCKSCLAIQNDTHPDVIELDAASKTGVNDIREIIDSSRYVPALGKYKIYIIDEVHMLSNNAFNALLKILEEPPANVIFIFATTEFRKIPLTIISRCQKFDLHRFSSEEIINHLKYISDKENIKYTTAGLKEIAKHSEGSLRDSISLFETIHIYKNNQEIIIDEKLVHKVLGISDTNHKYVLFEAILNGNFKEALDIINDIYYKGRDLPEILEQILWITNTLSKTLTIKNYLEDLDLLNSEKIILKEMSKKTDLINLTTIWQMIFKATEQLKNATNILQTIEMIMLKLCYLSRLPSLESIISQSYKNLQNPTISKSYSNQPTQNTSSPNLEKNSIRFSSFEDIVELFRKNQEIVLYHQLMEETNITNFTIGKIEIVIGKSLPSNFSKQISEKLEQWTNQKWQMIISKSEIFPHKTLRAQQEEKIKKENTIVKDILESFPSAKIKSIVDIN